MMQAKRRVLASAIAASGSSNAPGTSITVTLSRGTPRASSSSSADSSSRVVMSPLNRATTMPTARCSPTGTPSSTEYPGGTVSSPGACSLESEKRSANGEGGSSSSSVSSCSGASTSAAGSSATARSATAGSATAGSVSGQPSNTFSLDASRSWSGGCGSASPTTVSPATASPATVSPDPSSSGSLSQLGVSYPALMRAA